MVWEITHRKLICPVAVISYMRLLHIKKCECGMCDQLILDKDVNSAPIHYVRGHFNKTLMVNRAVKRRTSRERGLNILRNVLKKDKCEVNNSICNGKLECHHIDKNPFNNSVDNLLLLCDTHHNLADNRNLDLSGLKKLSLIYTISSGKRRYKGVKLEDA